jgi:hypothetical protein
MKRIMLMAAAALALTALTACEPAMTITAKAPSSSVCGKDFVITGKVTPPKATSYVVLQIRSGGKWVDWQWWDFYHTHPAPMSGWIDAYQSQSDGSYWMQPRTPLNVGAVYAFRVRSAWSTAYSPTFYHKVVAPSSGSCPTTLWDTLEP